MQLGKGNFDKLEFLAKFQVIHTQIFKKSTIQSAFKRIKLKLYYYKVVFQQVRVLPGLTLAISSPLPNSTNKISSVYTTTPHCPHEIKN